MDNYQRKIWAENHARIRGALKDFKPHGAYELARTVNVMPSRIYAHLSLMVLDGSVSKEGSEFRLVNPVERMKQSIPTALGRIPNPSQLELVMIDDSDPTHTITIRENRKGDFKVLEYSSSFATVEVPVEDD